MRIWIFNNKYEKIILIWLWRFGFLSTNHIPISAIMFYTLFVIHSSLLNDKKWTLAIGFHLYTNEFCRSIFTERGLVFILEVKLIANQRDSIYTLRTHAGGIVVILIHISSLNRKSISEFEVLLLSILGIKNQDIRWTTSDLY